MKDQYQRFTEFVRAATIERAGSNHLYEVCTLSGEQSQAILDSTGIHVAGYHHAIDDGSIRHILKKHGNPLAEAARGQIAVAAEDFLLIPTIVTEYDSVRYLAKNKQGLDLILFEKEIGDVYFCVVEVRTGRKRLSLKTLYKRRAPNQ